MYRAASAVQCRLYLAYEDDGTVVTCCHKKKELQEYPIIKYFTAIDEDGYREATVLYNSMLKSILRKVSATSHDVYFTGDGNYRKDIYPEYKAGRPDKPLLYAPLKGFVLRKPNHHLINDQEADDALGINQHGGSIICSIDKDLLMIPGRHYNFVTDTFTTITPKQGMFNFYKQLLTGDRVDNIPGLHGIGPKKAEVILDGLTTEKEMYEKVLEAYEGDADTVERNARLLWIRRKENELWTSP